MKYVRLHLEDHISVGHIEQEYGIGHALVSSWVKRYLQDGEEALEPRNGNPYAALHRSKNTCIGWTMAASLCWTSLMWIHIWENIIISLMHRQVRVPIWKLSFLPIVP